MTEMSWFPPPDQWRAANPPIRSSPATRVLDDINNRQKMMDRIIDQFAVLSSARYAPDAKRTWCNIFAKDVTEALGCGLPQRIGGIETRANDLYDWLSSAVAPSLGWREVPLLVAGQRAEEGYPVVAAYKNHKGPGHIVVGRPARDRASLGLHVAMAGRQRAVFIPVAQAFPGLPFRCFTHD